MTVRATVQWALMALVAGGVARAFGAEAPATSGAVEVVIPAAGTTATTTVVTPPPRFDQWAPQPRLNCSLPAIDAWDVVRTVHAETDVARDTPETAVPVQIIFAQRPFQNPGLSKYSVIYRPSNWDLTERDRWMDLGLSFYISFRNQLKSDRQFARVLVTSPTISTVTERPRMSLDYRLEKTSGGVLSGTVYCVPARRGVLVFNLALEGQEPDAIQPVASELRAAVAKGLRRHTRSWTPYVVAVLLMVPVVVVAVMVVRKRRGAKAP